MAARLVPVISLTDAALAPYAGVRDRDLARSAGRGDGLFMAEGEVVVRVLVAQATGGRAKAFRVRSLLLEERRVGPLAEVLEALDPGITAYVAPQAMMDAVVGFPIHRGILALGERGAPLDAATLLEEDARAAGGAGAGGAAPGLLPLAVGLVGITNHDNVGSIFRNAAAFGARAVLLDPATCDPLYRKSIRVSVGGALLVPFARCASAEALLGIAEAAGWEVLGLSARGDAALDEAAPPDGTKGRLLLLGTEGDGLPDAILARVRRVRIDMTDALDSLNVAVASGIALHEAHRARRRARGLEPASG